MNYSLLRVTLIIWIAILYYVCLVKVEARKQITIQLEKKAKILPVHPDDLSNSPRNLIRLDFGTIPQSTRMSLPAGNFKFIKSLICKIFPIHCIFCQRELFEFHRTILGFVIEILH